MMKNHTERSYELAAERYAELGVDTASAIEAVKGRSLSIHCWQGDDVGGFESPDSTLDGGGIQVTGNYPGKARTVEELRADVDELMRLVPGTHRLNLHASYGEFGGRKVDRDAVEPAHFAGWIEWAKERGIGLDFNSTYFSHPLADSGYTLANRDAKVRSFWIEHAKRCRKIAQAMGKAQGNPSIHNVWIPDGEKDYPVDRYGRREILKDALDEVFAESLPASEVKDAVESKLFGIGSEAFVVGSHEFYLAYAITRKKVVCFDLGHYHPPELVADKISSTLQFVPELLLHISRPMRWDSDHVVIFNDDVRFLGEELVRSGKIDRVAMGLDFFDASINRLGAWALGTRSTQKALLAAYLQPHATLLDYEKSGNNFARLALLEELRTMPLGAVWDRLCIETGAPADRELIDRVERYEKTVLAKRA
jgi:L-rhamnose isomerase